ncbi:MAG: 1-deoxy-D-xylulose-5-phosphate reductoisomerase [Nitrospirae bacterium]|nr:1-deoxy-D-xylulose-5-phosphate reductoisomerase [Nitrospirota bacterium]
MKRITILGSTGSIGRSALNVIRRHRDSFRVVGLTAGCNHRLLLNQIKEFKPEIVAVLDGKSADAIKRQTLVSVFEGTEGIKRVAGYKKSDFVLSAIVGFAGLVPTLSAIRAGKTIGLANKESLVSAGEIVMAEAKKRNVRILPVDSEHSAILQCLEGKNIKDVRRIVLTASGGPFIGMQKNELINVTVEDALRHPSWKMGRKITVDSATLMNKGFEVMEAHYLFGIEPSKIKVLIHPESIIHSIVELNDGCNIAQMSLPDMKAPIAYALSYPERLNDVIPPLDLSDVGKLTFMSPDPEGFPCLSYAYKALRMGGTVPAVLNAANEVAVEAFLKRRIGFNDIPAIIKDTIRSHTKKDITGIESVIEADNWARKLSGDLIGSKERVFRKT